MKELKLDQNEVAIIKALLESVVDSNIGIECLHGWKSTRGMTEEQIEESYTSLKSKVGE